MESRGTLLVRAGNLTVNLPEEFEGQTAVSERGDCSRAIKNTQEKFSGKKWKFYIDIEANPTVRIDKY
jgi:hypothetical protein